MAVRWGKKNQTSSQNEGVFNKGSHPSKASSAYSRFQEKVSRDNPSFNYTFPCDGLDGYGSVRTKDELETIIISSNSEVAKPDTCRRRRVMAVQIMVSCQG